MGNNKDNFWTDERVIQFHKNYMGSEAADIHNYLKKYKASQTAIPLMSDTQKDKEWEILSFQSDLGNVCTLREDGKYAYPNHGGWELDVMLKSVKHTTAMKIHSVKRLSDNQIFSIGDIVETLYNKITIAGFKVSIDGDKMLVLKDYVGKNNLHSETQLEWLKHLPKEEQKEWEILQYYPPEVSDCTARIYSVKRNRDGEIFSIGDIISGIKYDSREITGFEIHGNDLTVKQAGGCSELCYINKTKKKEPAILFTTTDGIPIYDNNTTIWTITCAGQAVVSSAEYYNPSLKYFSSKEKAEEYKLWSEKRYSLNDIKSTLDKYVYPFDKKRIINELKQHK